jgi:GNAT superfamily N-acetyltransferase
MIKNISKSLQIRPVSFSTLRFMTLEIPEVDFLIDCGEAGGRSGTFERTEHAYNIRRTAMIIKTMKPENASDWFDFFDNRAFSDHPDWKGCYCTGPFTPRLKEYKSTNTIRKEYAKWLVEHDMMKGYLAYENGKVIGWCNVNMRSALPKYDDNSKDSESVLSIACFMVEKEYRRKGIAQKLLDRIIKDAREQGIRVIEAYPRKKAQTESGSFHGPYSMYEKNGFMSEKIKGMDVVRRYL